MSTVQVSTPPSGRSGPCSGRRQSWLAILAQRADERVPATSVRAGQGDRAIQAWCYRQECPDSDPCLARLPAGLPGREPSTFASESACAPVRPQPAPSPMGDYGTGIESDLGAETLGGGKRVLY